MHRTEDRHFTMLVDMVVTLRLTHARGQLAYGVVWGERSLFCSDLVEIPLLATFALALLDSWGLFCWKWVCTVVLVCLLLFFFYLPKGEILGWFI